MNTKGVSAGCFGMINVVTLPSNNNFVFTGAREFSLCGHDYYGVGVTPHYIVNQTLEDVKNGIDPVINKAFELVKAMKDEH